MKPIKFIVAFLIYLILFSEIHQCIIHRKKSPHDELDHKVEHVVRSIKSSQDVFFRNLKNLEKTFSNAKVKKALNKHVGNMQVTYIVNPLKFKSDVKDLYLDYNEFLESQDYKNHHDEISDHLHSLTSHYESLSEVKKLMIRQHVNSTFDEYEKHILNDVLDNSFVYNHDNFNLTSMIEMIPHYFAEFDGQHKQPKIEKSHKLSNDFSGFMESIHQEYNFSKMSNMTNKEKRAFIEEISQHLSTQKKKREGFSSFLSEYVHESVVQNDPLLDKYLSNKANNEDNNHFDFGKIKNFLRERNLMEEEKIEKLQLKDLIKSKRKTTHRFQQDNSNQSPQTPASSESTSSSDSKANNTQSSSSDSNQSSPQDNSTSSSNSTQKQDSSKKVFNQVKDKSAAIVGGQVLLDNMRKAIEKERDRIKIKETCDPKDMESQVNKIIEKKQQEAKEVQDDAQKMLSELDPRIMENAGKKDGAANMMKNLLLEFIMKMVELLVKHVPFFFFKICIPPGPLTFECCPEAMFFPQQLYHLFTFKEKNDKFKTAAKNYPNFLQVIDGMKRGKIFYYICAQGYLSLQESTLWNFCNLPSLMLMNPMVLMGFVPGDMPLCMWACILGMAFCLTLMENFAPCDGLFNLETLIKSIMSVPLRLTLMNAMSKCTYIPFLIRWNLVPPYPEDKKPAGDNGEEPKKEGEGKDGDGTGNEGEKEKKELNCDKEEPKENPSPFEEALKKLDPNGAEKAINDIKENTKIAEPDDRERIPPQVISKPVNKNIKVDLTLERNFDPDEYIHLLTNYMQNDNHLADRFSETFGKFEVEENFPLHTKRLIVTVRKERTEYETSTISGIYD